MTEYTILYNASTKSIALCEIGEQDKWMAWAEAHGWQRTGTIRSELTKRELIAQFAEVAI